MRGFGSMLSAVCARAPTSGVVAVARRGRRYLIVAAPMLLMSGPFIMPIAGVFLLATVVLNMSSPVREAGALVFVCAALWFVTAILLAGQFRNTPSDGPRAER